MFARRNRWLLWLSLPLLAVGCQGQGGSTLTQEASQDYLIGDPTWDAYARGKVEFQRGLHALIQEKTTGFEELSKLALDLQIALTERQAFQIQHVMASDPTRLNLTSGVDGLNSFNWEDSDEAALSQDESYVALNARVAELTDANNGHPQWDAFRLAVAENVFISEEYAALTAQLEESLNGLR